MNTFCEYLLPVWGFALWCLVRFVAVRLWRCEWEEEPPDKGG